MEKGILITALVLITGVVFGVGVWSQENSPPGSFSGTITKIDVANKEIVVQNNDAEAIFQWNNETRVNGPGETALPFEDLKKGMKVMVFYREGDRNRVVNRIDVRKPDRKTLKGLSFPFECGVRVC